MLVERISRRMFDMVHRRNLVYNTCWEDPRLDHEALELGPDDTVLVITSAGCNALDYALAGPQRVNAVDMNFRQNALLELKQAAIRELDHPTFFELFGRGRLESWHEVYDAKLRNQLGPISQRYWDKQGGKFFNAAKRSFYFRGSSGSFAWMMRWYIDRVARMRAEVTEMLDAADLDEQRRVFSEKKIRQRLFKPFIRWALRRDMTLAMLGVPRSQRRQLDREYPGGVSGFVGDRIEEVFTRQTLSDNYFWRVYLTGEYTPTCCPRYLEPEHFAALKDGLVDRVQTHTASILGFLEGHEGTISRYVLLDHMDWLYARLQDVLQAEWQGIVDRAAPGTRILWRSAGLKCDFVDPLVVESSGTEHAVGDRLSYNTELAEKLHERDRVNTYGTFYIADLLPA